MAKLGHAIASMAFFLMATTVPAAGLSSADPAEECRLRLAESLEEMTNRPLLKEEHATALMWLRLDAQTALQAGKIEECAKYMDVVEILLNMK